MSHTSAPTAGAQLSDRVVALLRTAVPTLWGTIVTWLLAQAAAHLPASIADALAGVLQSEATVGFVVLLAVTGWYALWRWAEPHVPAWLVRVVLGSSRTPTYAGPGEVAVVLSPVDPDASDDEDDDEDSGYDPFTDPYPGETHS